MSDINYRNSKEFQALDGQSPPSRELLNGIFKNARFDTRFYAEIQSFSNPGTTPGAAKFLISAALEPSSHADSDFDQWYRDEHLLVLSRAPGFVRSRRYELVNGTTLNEFERSEPKVPKYLALHEFAGDLLPWKELAESAETEWAKKVMETLVRDEVGWFVCKRKYSEEEWSNV